MSCCLGKILPEKNFRNLSSTLASVRAAGDDIAEERIELITYRQSGRLLQSFLRLRQSRGSCWEAIKDLREAKMVLTDKNVVILVETLYNDREFWYLYYRLKEEGAEVCVVGFALRFN
jgi:hypothetical protein